MEDTKIVELYLARSEDAISETDKKYGKYCHCIAYNILYSPEDAEECVSDTFLKAWNTIPPQKPQRLSAFLGTITRNIALNRYKHDRAEKRRAPAAVIFEEAEEARTAPCEGDGIADELALREAINSFVASLPRETRIVFVRRYWYLSPIADIARDCGIPQGTVKSILSRTRKRFRAHLLKEGITV